MKCAGCSREQLRLRVWKNGKKYCLNCYEEIISVVSEYERKRDN